MNNYSVKIVESSSQLSPKERIMMKDTSLAESLDVLTQEGEINIDVKDYVLLDVHNEKNEDNPDYSILMIIDKQGDIYKTSSEIFARSFLDIYNEMAAENLTDEITIRVDRKPSKNYANKEFLKPVLI